MDSDSSSITLISFSSYAHFIPQAPNVSEVCRPPVWKSLREQVRWLPRSPCRRKFIALKSDATFWFNCTLSDVTIHVAFYDKCVFLLPRLNGARTSRLLNQGSTWSICLLVRFILDCSLALLECNSWAIRVYKLTEITGDVKNATILKPDVGVKFQDHLFVHFAF